MPDSQESQEKSGNLFFSDLAAPDGEARADAASSPPPKGSPYFTDVGFDFEPDEESSEYPPLEAEAPPPSPGPKSTVEDILAATFKDKLPPELADRYESDSSFRTRVDNDPVLAWRLANLNQDELARIQENPADLSWLIGGDAPTTVYKEAPGLNTLPQAPVNDDADPTVVRDEGSGALMKSSDALDKTEIVDSNTFLRSDDKTYVFGPDDRPPTEEREEQATPPTAEDQKSDSNPLIDSLFDGTPLQDGAFLDDSDAMYIPGLDDRHESSESSDFGVGDVLPPALAAAMAGEVGNNLDDDLAMDDILAALPASDDAPPDMFSNVFAEGPESGFGTDLAGLGGEDEVVLDALDSDLPPPDLLADALPAAMPGAGAERSAPALPEEDWSTGGMSFEADDAVVSVPAEEGGWGAVEADGEGGTWGAAESDYPDLVASSSDHEAPPGELEADNIDGSLLDEAMALPGESSVDLASSAAEVPDLLGTGYPEEPLQAEEDSLSAANALDDDDVLPDLISALPSDLAAAPAGNAGSDSVVDIEAIFDDVAPLADLATGTDDSWDEALAEAPEPVAVDSVAEGLASELGALDGLESPESAEGEEQAAIEALAPLEVPDEPLDAGSAMDPVEVLREGLEEGREGVKGMDTVELLEAGLQAEDSLENLEDVWGGAKQGGAGHELPLDMMGDVSELPSDIPEDAFGGATADRAGALDDLLKGFEEEGGALENLDELEDEETESKSRTNILKALAQKGTMAKLAALPLALSLYGYKKLNKAVDLRRNWGIYCDLAAALIATVSLATLAARFIYF